MRPELGGWALRQGQTWEIAQLGSYQLGKYPWEVALAAAWEKAFGMLPNIGESSLEPM